MPKADVSPIPFTLLGAALFAQMQRILVLGVRSSCPNGGSCPPDCLLGAGAQSKLPTQLLAEAGYQTPSTPWDAWALTQRHWEPANSP